MELELGVCRTGGAPHPREGHRGWGGGVASLPAIDRNVTKESYFKITFLLSIALIIKTAGQLPSPDGGRRCPQLSGAEGCAGS